MGRKTRTRSQAMVAAAERRWRMITTAMARPYAVPAMRSMVQTDGMSAEVLHDPARQRRGGLGVLHHPVEERRLVDETARDRWEAGDEALHLEEVGARVVGLVLAGNARHRLVGSDGEPGFLQRRDDLGDLGALGSGDQAAPAR